MSDTATYKPKEEQEEQAAKTVKLPLRGLVYESEDIPGKFVAHCLELDVVAVGDTPDAAKALLLELVEDLIEAVTADDQTMDKLLHPAPTEYWIKWATKAKRKRPQWDIFYWLAVWCRGRIPREEIEFAGAGC